MKKTLLLIVLCLSATLCAAPANPNVCEGTDSELFLNPFIESELKEVSGQIVLDAGCGLAPRTIIAAKNGAKVCAVDAKKNLLEQAQAAAETAGVLSQISFCQADMQKLPFDSNSFDKTLFVNTLTDIEATKHLIVQNQPLQTGFGAYLKEIARVMKEEGRLLIAAPASYGVLFTDGSVSDESARQHIEQVLALIDDSQDSSLIVDKLSELTEVMRATFVQGDEGLKLVTDEKSLRIGQQVWCKIPEGVISCFYHSEEECLVEIKRAGLVCEEIKRPCFFGKVKYDMWHKSNQEIGKSLGDAYMNSNPFTLYYVVKKS